MGVLDNGAYPADPYTDRFKFLPGTTTPNPFYTSLFKISANDTDQMAQDEFVRSSLKADYVFHGGITLQTVTAYQTGNTAYKGDLYSTGPGSATRSWSAVACTPMFSPRPDLAVPTSRRSSTMLMKRSGLRKST